jgi:hypothetical protein
MTQSINFDDWDDDQDESASTSDSHETQGITHAGPSPLEFLPDPLAHGLPKDHGGGLELDMNSIHGEIQAAGEIESWAESTPWSGPATMVDQADLDSVAWQPQTTDFTCGVQSAGSVLRLVTGEDLSEAALTYEATKHGWLSDDGMTLPSIASLLENHGVDCLLVSDGDVDQLVGDLQHGNKVIAAVDKDVLWGQDLYPDRADHALVVTGLRIDDQGVPYVVCNDSAMPDGAAKEYLLEDFMDAWQGSRFSYVVARGGLPL